MEDSLQCEQTGEELHLQDGLNTTHSAAASLPTEFNWTLFTNFKLLNLKIILLYLLMFQNISVISKIILKLQQKPSSG